MWELAGFMWKWIFIIIVCLIIIIANGFNFFVGMVLTGIGIVGAMVASLLFYVKYKEYIRVNILGCKKECSDKEAEIQFKNQLWQHRISVPRYSINICDYLRELESKNLHLEIVKEEGVIYKPRKGGYIGSKEWQDKWSWLVFSPKITPSKFVKSIKVILRANGMNFINVSQVRNGCSYEIFMFLDCLRYNIVIKENDDNLRICEVDSPSILRKRLRNKTTTTKAG